MRTTAKPLAILLALGTAACGARTVGADRPVAPAPAPSGPALARDEVVPVIGTDLTIERVSSSEFANGLASGRWRRWDAPGQVEAEVLGFDDGVAADAHALVVTQCQPGGPGLTFYVDGQQQIRTAATAAAVDDTDGGGRIMDLPAARCYRTRYALAAGQAYVGTIEFTP